MEEPINNSALDLEVSGNNESVNKTEKAAKPFTNGIDSNLDEPNWNNDTVATEIDLYMLSTITAYTNIDSLYGLPFTSQYDSNWGMKEFQQTGYGATVPELSDNLISMNDVDVLDKTLFTSDAYVNALSYLIFLERKRMDAVKMRGCVNGRSQQECISKDE